MARFNQYTFSRHVRVSSDHKPLESILSKPLAASPRRLREVIMRLQKYDFEVTLLTCCREHIFPRKATINMGSYLSVAEERLGEISPGTQVYHHTWLAWRQEGFSPQVHPFFNVRDELTFQDGLISVYNEWLSWILS